LMRLTCCAGSLDGMTCFANFESGTSVSPAGRPPPDLRRIAEVLVDERPLPLARLLVRVRHGEDALQDDLPRLAFRLPARFAAAAMILGACSGSASVQMPSTSLPASSAAPSWNADR